MPGVFGVLADPNDAKAPEPKPKALEAPVVGEAKALPGVFKEPPLPADTSPPWRLTYEWRELESGPLFAGVERESLLVLRRRRES